MFQLTNSKSCLAQWDEKSNDIKVDKRCRIEVFRISKPERRQDLLVIPNYFRLFIPEDLIWNPDSNYVNVMARQIKCLGDSYIDVFLAFPESRRRCESLLNDYLSSCFLPPSSSACWDACPSPATRTCCWLPALPLAVQLWIWKHRCPVCTTTKQVD